MGQTVFVYLLGVPILYWDPGMPVVRVQEWPKACGHTKGRRVVSREEAVMRIRAAVDEREEGPGDIVIVARSVLLLKQRVQHKQ